MYTIKPLELQNIRALKHFTDTAIGKDYYSPSELEEIYRKSKKGGQIFTLLLWDDRNEICGARITYPQGNWQHGKGKGLNPHLWGVAREHVAYFQSLFLSQHLTGQGWGKKMSLQSIEMLKAIGTQAIVTHSWKESPNDSSGRYLRSLGFQVVATHEKYWHEVDYDCTRCGRPCLCTAEEMIFKVND